MNCLREECFVNEFWEVGFWKRITYAIRITAGQDCSDIFRCIVFFRNIKNFHGVVEFCYFFS